jgi:hypothetical protein
MNVIARIKEGEDTLDELHAMASHELQRALSLTV